MKKINSKNKHDRKGLTPEKRRKLEELSLAKKEIESIFNQRQSDSKRKDSGISQKVIEYGILALILFSPLPAASVYEWSILVFQLMIFIMMAAYFIGKEASPASGALTAQLKWPRYLFSGAALYIFFQILPLPYFMVKILSPKAFSFRELFSPEFNQFKFMSISLMPNHTFREGLELLTYFLFGFLIIKTITKKKQILRLIYALVALGTFQTFYGFFELYNKSPRILFYKKEFYLNDVTGTFVNRNHFSGYLEMIIPLAIGLLLSRINLNSITNLNWKNRLLRLSEKGKYKNFLLGLSIILMSLGIIFSRSRSGNFLLFFSIFLFLILSLIYSSRKKIHGKGLKRIFSIFILGIIFMTLYLGIDATIERFTMEKILADQRPIFWSQTADIIGDFPLLGSGLGTFAEIYPAYEKTGIQAHLSHAHNDFLEYISELGILGFLFLFGGIFFILIKVFLSWRERRDPEVRAIVLGCMISVTIILIHSITDFNLHIPANMLLFTVVISLMILTVSIGKSDSRHEKISTHPLSRPMAKKILSLSAIIVLATAAFLLYWNQFLHSRAIQTSSYQERIKLLEKVTQFYPFNDKVYYELGKAYYSRGFDNILDIPTRDTALQKSISSYNRSLHLNPISYFSHFHLAHSLRLTAFLSNEISLDADNELKKAARLTGHNYQIYFEVGKDFLSRWDELSDEDREFTIDILSKMASVRDRERLQALMHYWEINSLNYEVMEKILPENASTYRMYAQFLGEKSLDLNVRYQYLATAEAMEFEEAQQAFKAGENSFLYRRVQKAIQYYQDCYEKLIKIKFFQNFYDAAPIAVDEFNQILKATHLQLLKCKIILGQELNQIKVHLDKYLEMEEGIGSLSELELFLKNHRVISGELEIVADDSEPMLIQMALYLKQNRFQEIIRFGGQIQTSYVGTSGIQRDQYIKALLMLGDAYQEANYNYDAENIYMKALEMAPDNLDILLRLRQNYSKLNDEVKIQAINSRISRYLSPKNISLRQAFVEREHKFGKKFKLDGGKKTIELYLERSESDIDPLISLFFNGRVVWEGFSSRNPLSLELDVLEGENKLEVQPLNMPITLQRIIWH